uniref:Uncharacterized protein n=1 Tax=Mycena chlorophos TaxID=658473 RepID=A0ABQ0M6B9_MYCCL|nr:predicted protein [Mycena chlorophos]
MADDVPIPLDDPAPPTTTTAASSSTALSLSSLSAANVKSIPGHLDQQLVATDSTARPGETTLTTTRGMDGDGNGNGNDGRGKVPHGTLPHSETWDEEKRAYIRSIHHSEAALIPTDLAISTAGRSQSKSRTGQALDLLLLLLLFWIAPRKETATSDKVSRRRSSQEYSQSAHCSTRPPSLPSAMLLSTDLISQFSRFKMMRRRPFFMIEKLHAPSKRMLHRLIRTHDAPNPSAGTRIDCLPLIASAVLLPLLYAP